MAENRIILKTEGVSKYFGGLGALDNINFNMPTRSGLRAIIGPNGAGKTTFFNVVTGVLHPTKGDIYFEGRKITGMPIHEVSKIGIARTLQIKSVFNKMEVGNNIRVAVQSRQRFMNPFRNHMSFGEINRKVDEILDLLELKKFERELAENLDYGNLCTLELGLALGTNPKLLLLDEPVSGMSPVETQRTVKIMKRLSEKVDLILIEHDMEVVLNVADVITVLDFGKVIAEGTPAEITENPRVQEAYLGGIKYAKPQ